MRWAASHFVHLDGTGSLPPLRLDNFRQIRRRY